MPASNFPRGYLDLPDGLTQPLPLPLPSCVGHIGSRPPHLCSPACLHPPSRGVVTAPPRDAPRLLTLWSSAQSRALLLTTVPVALASVSSLKAVLSSTLEKFSPFPSQPAPAFVDEVAAVVERAGRELTIERTLTRITALLTTFHDLIFSHSLSTLRIRCNQPQTGDQHVGTRLPYWSGSKQLVDTTRWDSCYFV